MPQIKTFIVKATVKGGSLTMDHANKKPAEGEDAFSQSISEDEIAKKAQEVAEFNNIEKTTYESFEDGEYDVEFRAIV